MRNIILAINDETLAASRAYAKKHEVTVNALVRQLLGRTVQQDSTAKIGELLRLMDEYPGNSGEWKWNWKELCG